MHKNRSQTTTAASPLREFKISLEDIFEKALRQYAFPRSPVRPLAQPKIVPITVNAKRSAANRGSKSSGSSKKRNGKLERSSADSSKPEVVLTGRAVQLVAMLQQPGGATIEQIMKTTGWRAPSVRGFLSGVLRKKLGLKIESKKVDGERRYVISP